MDPVFALSLSREVEKLGSWAGFIAIPGLGLLALLYIAQAREVKRLREWAGRAPERASEVQSRIARQVAEQRGTGAQQAVAPAPSQPQRVTAQPRSNLPKLAPRVAAETGELTTPAPPQPPAQPAPEKKVVGSPAVLFAKPKPTPQPVAAIPAAPPAPAPSPPTPAPPPAATPAARAAATTRPAPSPPPRPASPPPPPRPATPARPQPASPRPAASRPPSRPPARPPARPQPKQADRGNYATLGVVAAVAAAIVIVLLTSGGGSSSHPKATSTAASAPATAAPGQTVVRSQTTVAVLNGTTIPGLAAQVADQLVRGGFKRGSVTNAADQQVGRTTVAYAPGFREAAVEVSRLLGTPSPSPLDSATQAIAGQDASVVVTVGSDRAR